MLFFVVHGLVVSTWVSRIPSIKSALRLGDGVFGLALLGTAIGSVTAIPVCGWLVTRFGSTRMARATGAGFCLALVMPALAHHAITLFAALFIYGAMAGANDVAMNALAVGTEKRLGTPTMSRFHAMFSVGGILGASLGGAVAGHGVSPLPHLAFLGACFLALAFTAAHFSYRELPERSPVSRVPVRPSLRRIPLPLVALSAIGFCIFLSEGAIADWTGVFLKQVLGSSDGTAAAGYAVFSAAMAIFRFCGDALTVRFGRAVVIRTGGLVASAGVLLAVTAYQPAFALAGFAAAGAGFSSIIPLVFAAGGRVGTVSAGAGVATVSGIGYLGFLVGPPAIGFISEISSLRAGLFLLAVLSATAALLVGVVQRRNPEALQ
ncbi:MAG: MFS transporter [Bryobacteraceae bacterium]